MKRLAPLALAAVLAPAVLAAGPYERMLASQAEIRAYLVAEARQVTAQARRELSDRASWEAVRDTRRQEMREMLGLDPGPARTPLNVRITGTIDRGDYVIEKIAFESLPRVYVTANLYLPKKRQLGKAPAVIYVCGHTFNDYGSKASYQRHPITFAKHGYASLIIDPIQIAETFALHHGIGNNEMYDWYARGYSPAGLEVWNVIRALDYLETRPEIDSSRFGITGRSGGAAMSWFAASVDERLRVVAPVMGISTYEANVDADTQRLHCDCMFPVNAWMHDMLHQGALIAPRPLLMMHGRRDALFPEPGYTAFEKIVGGLYEAFDLPGRFANFVVDTGHEDSDLLRAKSVEWFDEHLLGVPAREIDVEVEVDELPHEELAVFGGEPPADALNYRAHELFIPAPPEPEYSSLEAWTARREELLTRLRERVFAAFPEAGPVPETVPGALAADNFEAVAFESEPGITVEALLRRRPEDRPEDNAPAMLYVASDGEDWLAARDTLNQVARWHTLMIVHPRGVGEVPWPKKFWKDVLRNAMHVGRTVDSMRLWDVLQAARVLRRETGREVVTAGIGVSGALGLYAAVLDERIPQAILIDAPTTHRDAPIFLNVLRYTDLPEAAALIAPRRLTFYGRMPAEFEATKRIFALHGKADHVAVSMSVAAALAGRFDHRFSSGL